jgi:hypothetical protein
VSTAIQNFAPRSVSWAVAPNGEVRAAVVVADRGADAIAAAQDAAAPL